MKNDYSKTDDFSIEELVNQISCTPNEYKNLQIFLHWDRKIDYHSETEFLMVTPKCFGKVKILNLNVEDDYVVIEFLDCGTKQVGNVRININDEIPRVLFVNWLDVRKIVFEESAKFNSDELLELEY